MAKNKQAKASQRAGFSLLEVILAMSILLASGIVLAELASLGAAHGRSAEDLTTAQWICQAKLNEILTGLAPLEPAEDTPVEDRPGWLFSLEIEPINRPGMPAQLAALRVTVSQDVEEGQRARQFTLTRWISDPDLLGNQDAETGSKRPGREPPP